MKKLLVAAALLLAQVAPAAAANLNCWDTRNIRTNSSPAGTYRNTASSSVDYIEATNTGVAKLFASLSLPAYATGNYAICLEGTSTWVGSKRVWKVSAAVICYMNRVSHNTCQG
jgi:hypothetical protein